jgi:hypothetical protein
MNVKKWLGKVRFKAAWQSLSEKPALMGGLMGFAAASLLIWLLGICGLIGGSSVSFTEQELNIARRSTRHASAVLNSFLGYGRDGYGWRHYLRFEELQYQLIEGLPHQEADQTVLREVIDLLSQRHVGLDLPEFVGLKTALSAYVKMLAVSVDPIEPRAPPDRVAAQRRINR